jgi:hypothetical protein
MAVFMAAVVVVYSNQEQIFTLVRALVAQCELFGLAPLVHSHQPALAILN